MIRIIKKVLFTLFDLVATSALLRGKIYALFGGNIGRNVKLEKLILVNYTGENLGNLHIADNVYIGGGTVLDLKSELYIGKSTKLAAGVNISTHVDCGIENPICRLYPLREEKTVIGSHSWIGLGCIIMCGVHIGDHSIVGAGSLVNKNIPDKVVAYGSPAKVVKKLNFDTRPMEEVLKK